MFLGEFKLTVNLNDSVYFYHPESSEITCGTICKVTKRNNLTGLPQKLFTMITHQPIQKKKHVVITEDYIVSFSDLLFA